MKIGVIMPLGEDEELEQPFSYTDVRSMALQAEEAGFDSLWVADHLLFRLPNRPAFGIWESWSTLTALAEATNRIELGTLVLSMPFRNPALLAKMAITTDEVSGGRLILGLGAGWHEPEFEAFGMQYERRADQFEEGIRIISPLLRDGKVDFQGKYFSAPACELRPRGSRPGGPPVLIAARGKRMLRLTAQYADQWNAAWFARPEPFLERYVELVRACDTVGRDPETIATTVALYVVYPEQLSEHQREILPESHMDPNKILRGGPEQVAEGLLAFANHGIDQLICNPVPNTPATLSKLTEALQLLRD